jgi:hypothetical protein
LGRNGRVVTLSENEVKARENSCAFSRVVKIFTRIFTRGEIFHDPSKKPSDHRAVEKTNGLAAVGGPARIRSGRCVHSSLAENDWGLSFSASRYCTR